MGVVSRFMAGLVGSCEKRSPTSMGTYLGTYF